MMHNASILSKGEFSRAWGIACPCGFSHSAESRDRAMRIARRHTEAPEISAALAEYYADAVASDGIADERAIANHYGKEAR